MKRHTVFLICSWIMLFSSVAAHAQQGFTGPGGFAPYTGPSLIVTAVQVQTYPDKAPVVLAGNIINALPGGKYYTFRDATGDILIEIDWKVWQGLTVGVSDRVEISGEAKTKNRPASVKVKAIRKI